MLASRHHVGWDSLQCFCRPTERRDRSALDQSKCIALPAPTFSPGVIAWREVQVYERRLSPEPVSMPECGGSTVASCCDGATGCWRDTTNAPSFAGDGK
jgi:hypothetical protein